MKNILIISFITFSFTINLYSQGPILIVGIDTEYGKRPGNTSHGSISTWANIFQTGILTNVTNGQNRILVIGGRKNNGDIKDFWTKIGSNLGIPVDFKHEKKILFWTNTNEIRDVNFTNYSLIAVANSHDGGGKLTQRELNELNKRQDDFADYICNGGGLFASSCTLNNPHDYIAKVGNITVTHQSYGDVTPTVNGTAIGITNTNLDTGPWHVRFNSFPSFMSVLANVTGTNNIAAIGGIQSGGDAIADFSLPKETFCIYEDIVADPTISQNTGDHFWSIQESDANWNRFGTEITQWFTGSPTIRNLTNFANSKNFNFKCNTYYRIKLAVNGLCTEWNEKTKLVKFSCPNANAGVDLCCSNLTGFPTLGTNYSNNNFSFEWFPKYGLTFPYQSKTFLDCDNDDLNEFDCFEYTLKVTDENGCIAEDKATVYFDSPKFNIIQEQGCCKNNLSIQDDGCFSNILWSTGEKSKSISVSQSGAYSVTVSNACGQTSKSITVPTTNIITGFFNTIAYNSKFYPPSGGAGYSDKLYIKDVMSGNGAANVPNSYNATEYKLEIFNRWGNLFRTITGSSCNGFDNWAVNWDGKDQNGNIVQIGEYNWKLYFKNCQYKNWTFPKERRFKQRECLDCGGWPGNGCGFWNRCKEWNVPAGTTEDVIITEGSVTVVR